MMAREAAVTQPLARVAITGLEAVSVLVIDDHGRGWLGPDAFLMCLWATKRWRPMSFRLTGTAFSPLAERFFHTLSANRSLVSGMLSTHHCDGDHCGVEVAR